MHNHLNHLNQPVGYPLNGWKPPPHPAREMLQGRFCRLEPVDPLRHAESLYQANALDTDGRNWTYLPYGPFESVDSFRTWLEQSCCGNDPHFYAIVERDKGQAVVVKGRNRDTAWYAAIDQEWPELKMAFEKWLNPRNFDGQGRQRTPLSALTAPLLKQRG